MNCGRCLRSICGIVPVSISGSGASTGLVNSIRSITTTETGSVLPRPHKSKFGLIGIACTVIPGLLIGATISKKMANFLEENELFVPSDDDDDDD